MKHLRNRMLEPKPAPVLEADKSPVPRFSELKWEAGREGYCEWAEVDFSNGWRATFLRGRGKNASIHMNPNTPHLYVGPYEICAWDPNGEPNPDELEGDWPKHGDAKTMQKHMATIAGMSADG